jgi:hypothetical protein
VASDIGTLSSETLEASQTMDLTAHQLHHRVTDLMRFSTQGTQVSQSLVHRVKTAQTALDDLIHLVQKTDRPHTFSRSLTAPGPTVHSLIERVEQAKAVLAELETMFDPTQIYNSKSLLTQERSQAISRLNAYTTTPQPME